MKKFPEEGVVGKDAIREAEASVELRDHIEMVRDAINDEVKSRTGEDDAWTYVDAIYSDRVISEEDGRYYQYSYTVDAERKVTLGARVEVMREFTPVAASKQINSALIESVEDDAGNNKGNVYQIRVIRSGASINKKFYTDVCLREAVPLFEGVRVFIKSDEEHLKGEGKSVRNLLGGLRDAQFIEGAIVDTGEIRAQFHVFESAGAIAGMLREAVERDMMNLFGFSVDVLGLTRNKGEFKEAVKFVQVKSVDMIIAPGAGGELINLIEAVGSDENHEEKDMLKDKMLAKIREANGGNLPEGLDETNDDAVFEAFREAEVTLSASDSDEPAPLTREDMEQFEMRNTMRESVKDSGLPDQAQTKLLKTLGSEPKLTLVRIAEAITEEREYLASFSESGKPSGLGFPGGDASVDGVQEMLSKFFDPADREVISIKECYQEATGDKMVTGRTSNCRAMRMVEAVDTSTFPNLLGDEMNRRMVDRYNGEERFDVYKKVVSSMPPFTDFRTRKSVRIGGYGDLPAVAENGAYTALTTPGEESAEYAPTKRGGTETVSLESIKNDDVGVITSIPRRLGTSAKRTLAKFVLDFLRTNPAIYDTKALFHVDHNNLLTAALGAVSYAASRLAMMDQVELGVVAERMGITPALMLIPGALEQTAFDMFQRGTNVDKDLVQSSAPQIESVWYWTDPNDWLLVADGNDVDLIEIGFLDDKQDPEIFIQDNPSQGSLFTNDQIKYKIRHIYGGDVADYRGFQKNVVI